MALWVPVVAWMVLIYALSSVPNVPEEPGLPHAPLQWLEDLIRGAAHLVEFGVLTLLVRRAMRGSWQAGQATLGAGLWSLAYAAGDELHQSFVAGRTCSLHDWLLDFLGVALALLAVFLPWHRPTE